MTPAPAAFLTALEDAARLSGATPSAIFAEALLMVPDGYLLRADPPLEPCPHIPPALLPVLDDMARSFGFTREGLLLEMSGFLHKAAAALIAHDEERARAVREAGRVRDIRI